MNIKTYHRITQYLQTESHSLRSMLTLSVLGNVFLLLIPFIIQQLLEQFSILVFQQTTVFLIVLAIIFLTAIAFMQLLQMHFSERLQRRLFLKGTQRIQANILNAKERGLEFNASKINFSFELINLQKTLVPLIIDGSTIAAQAVFVFILISLYHSLFFIYSLLIIAGLYYALFFLGKKTQALSLLESKNKYLVIDSLQNMPQTNYDPASLETSLLNYFLVRETRYKHYFRQAFWVFLIKVVASALLLSLGGFLVVCQKMRIGQLFASELIITNLLISLFKFTHLLDYWYDTIVAIDKIETHFPLGGAQ